MATGRLLTLDDFVPDAAERLRVRDKLIREMADASNLSPEQYLRRVTTYINPDASVTLTSADFPLSHVARIGSRLVFSFGQGDIAPYVEGCPIYSVTL